MTPATGTGMATKAGIATTGVILLANHLPLLGVITALGAGVFFGIALPAVWSANPARRSAALAVLKEVLASLRNSRSS